jgi:hypothetical protein
LLSSLAIELVVGARDDSRSNENFEAPGEKAKPAVLLFLFLFEGEVMGGMRWADASCT